MRNQWIGTVMFALRILSGSIRRCHEWRRLSRGLQLQLPKRGLQLQLPTSAPKLQLLPSGLQELQLQLPLSGLPLQLPPDRYGFQPFRSLAVL